MLSVLWWIMSIRIIINNQNFCFKTFCTVDKKKRGKHKPKWLLAWRLEACSSYRPFTIILAILEPMAWFQAFFIIGSEIKKVWWLVDLSNPGSWKRFLIAIDILELTIAYNCHNCFKRKSTEYSFWKCITNTNDIINVVIVYIMSIVTSSLMITVE